MDGRSCIVCRKPVTLGNSQKHECGHRTHTGCFKSLDEVNYAQCHHCAGKLDFAAPLLPAVEPGSLSGRDYIDNPLPPRGKLAAGLKLVTGLIKRAEDPLQLIAQGRQACPIDWLIREKGLGLQRLLESQVCLDDLLTHGYRWPDLMLFKDIASPGRRKQALLALGLEAHHLCCELNEHLAETGFTPKDMIDLLGLRFPMEGVAARDLVALGWKAPDLYTAGLQYIEDYAALDPDDCDEAALGMTQAMVNALPSAAPVPALAPVQVSAPAAPTTIMVQILPAPVAAPAPVAPQVTRAPIVRHHGLRK